MFRFKLTASPNLDDPATQAELDTPDAVEKYLLRMKEERLITLELYDADGFVLRRLPIPLSIGIGQPSDKVIMLLSNEAAQMDLDEYKMFCNGGTWTVTWLPDPLGPK